MSRRSPRRLTLFETQRQIRDAAVQRQEISINQTEQGLLLVVDGKIKGFAEGASPQLTIVGCDVENYSGLEDWEQYYVGTLLPLHIRQSFSYAGITTKQIAGISGTGDGALMALKTDDIWQSILFVLNLWKNGVQCGFGRGLRVALATGSCLEGQRFAGTQQMQGYGLVETSRILSCDKSTHVMFSLSTWSLVCSEEELTTSKTYRNLTIGLNRGEKIFRGKFKPKDRNELAFVNCFGYIIDDSGTWGFGLESESGLSEPGKEKKAS